MAHSLRRAASRMSARSVGLAGTTLAAFSYFTAFVGAPALAGDSAPPKEGPADKADAPDVEPEKEIRPCVMLLPEGGVAGHFQTNLWPLGEVRYTFAPGVTEANKKRVFDAMNELESVCGVRFLLHIPGVTFNRIVFQNGNQNSSFVGMIGGSQPIKIFNWESHYVIVHEIMHALGFWHEQQRADRDTYVTVQPANIQQGSEHNFASLDGVAGGQCPSTFGVYDFDSVMHYRACAFSTCSALCTSDNDDCTTIVVNEPWHSQWQSEIGQRTHLSEGDIATLNMLYPKQFTNELIRFETGLHSAAQPLHDGTYGYSIDANATRLVVGAPGFESMLTIDAAYVVGASNGFEYLKLVPSDLAPGARFGHSVAIDRHDAPDAPYVVVGAPPYGAIFLGDLGSAYVFDSVTGEEVTKLEASDAEYGRIFGHAVSIDWFRAIVGAPFGVFDVIPLSDWGAAYVFDPSDGTQIAKLLPTDTLGTYAGFGTSVDIHLLEAIVGSPADDHAGFVSGSAYIFEAVVGGAQRFKLTASDAHPMQLFGTSVAIGAQYALVGAPGDIHAGSNSGAAYVFDVQTGQQLHKLTPAHPRSGQSFGRSVAIQGTWGIVGAPGSDHLSPDGAAYVFELASGMQLFKLDACAGENADGVGFSVALSANAAFVGAHRRPYSVGPPPTLMNAGAVFAFDSSLVAGTPWGPGDLDGDGDVDAADLTTLLGAWGPCDLCAADIDENGEVNSADLAILLGAWTG